MTHETTRPHENASSLSSCRRPAAGALAIALVLGSFATTGWALPPRIEFETSLLEIAEDERDPWVSFRLVDCAAREPAGAVDVRVLATPGSAEEGVDFFAFGRGVLGSSTSSGGRVLRSGDVPLEIVHDDLDEGPEEFTLHLELGPGSTLDCGDGPRTPDVGPPITVRILDVPKDLSLVSFRTEEVHVTEADGAERRVARLAVSRSGGRMPVSVLCQTTRAGSASEHEDFEAVSSVLGWGEGDTGDKWCEVPILGDDHPENPETVSVSLVALAGKLELGAARATVHIRDDDSPGRVQFTAVRFTAREKEAAVVELERRWGSEGPSSVRVVVTSRGARPETAARPVELEVHWGPGEDGPRDLRIPVRDDGDGDATLFLKLEAATPATLLGDLKDAVLFIEGDVPDLAGDVVAAAGGSDDDPGGSE